MVRTVRERVLSSGPKSLSIVAWLLALVVVAPARVLAAAPLARISYGSCKPGTSFEQYVECTRRSHSSPSFRLLASGVQRHEVALISLQAIATKNEFVPALLPKRTHDLQRVEPRRHDADHLRRQRPLVERLSGFGGLLTRPRCCIRLHVQRHTCLSSVVDRMITDWHFGLAGQDAADLTLVSISKRRLFIPEERIGSEVQFA